MTKRLMVKKLHELTKKAKYIALGVIAAAVLTGVGTMAYSGVSPKVVVEGDYIEAAIEAGTDLLGISSNATGLTDVDVTGELRAALVTTSATSTLNGLSTIVRTSSFADATTTLFAVRNPFGATSTVDLAILNITGVSTSTIDISVATSTSQFPLTVASTSLINAAVVNTSTFAYVVNGATIGSSSGMTSAGTNTQARVQVGPNDFIVGFVANNANLGSVQGVINPSNTFAGTFQLRFTR